MLPGKDMRKLPLLLRSQHFQTVIHRTAVLKSIENIPGRTVDTLRSSGTN